MKLMAIDSAFLKLQIFLNCVSMFFSRQAHAGYDTRR